MRAAVFKGLHQPLVVETIEDPTPGAGEVVVKVCRCGICGSDLHITEDPIFGVPPGVVLGHEYAGEVVATGKDVTKVKVGDRVAAVPLQSCGKCAFCLAGDPAGCSQLSVGGGGYGQDSLIAERQAVRMPMGVSFEDGALIEPLAVGLHGVNVAGMRSGARVLVIGAGPIGLATAFWAKRMGAGKIAVTASSNRRANLAMEMGATHFVTPSDEDPVQAVNRALGGPPEYVFECVGKEGLIQRSIDHVDKRGKVVVVGLCTTMDSFSPFAMLHKEATIIPSAFYDVRDFQTALDVLESGVTAPNLMITETVDLEDMPPAFEALKERTTQCKTMVKPWA
jgi:(R,R)-butanediol dehydrogenase/meso-butanediol dehydrogenase/diacetyl reductase